MACDRVAWGERWSASLGSCVAASEAQGCDEQNQQTCYRAFLDALPEGGEQRTTEPVTGDEPQQMFAILKPVNPATTDVEFDKGPFVVCDSGPLASRGIIMGDIILELDGVALVSGEAFLKFVESSPAAGLKCKYFRPSEGKNHIYRYSK